MSKTKDEMYKEMMHDMDKMKKEYEKLHAEMCLLKRKRRSSDAKTERLNSVDVKSTRWRFIKRWRFFIKRV